MKWIWLDPYFFLGIIDGLRATALEFASEADPEEDQMKTLNFLKAGENFYLYYQNSLFRMAKCQEIVISIEQGRYITF